MDFSGELALTVSAIYTDDHIARLDQPLRLGFHRAGDGFSFYDEAFKRSFLDGGALSLTAQALTKSAVREDATAGTAFVNRVAAVDWRPETEGEPDPETAPQDPVEVIPTKTGTVKFCIRQMSTFIDAGIRGRAPVG